MEYPERLPPGAKWHTLADGSRQLVYSTMVEKPGNVTHACELLLEIHAKLRARHKGGGVVRGAVNVDVSAPVKTGPICFVPYFLGLDAKEWPISVPETVERFPKQGLRLATPYETLLWYRDRCPEPLPFDGLFAFGGISKNSRALLISQFSCKIAYVLGSRKPAVYPMRVDFNMPYHFAIATVVDSTE